MSAIPADVQQASHITGVPAGLLWAQLGQESGNRQGAVSPKGARGRMQLMPGTAAGLAKRYKLDTNTPYGNLLAGAYYLKEQYHAFKSWRLALAAYNAGPGAVRQYGGVPPYAETQGYVRKILERAGVLPSGTRASTSTHAPTPDAPQFDAKAAALHSSTSIAQGEYDPIGELQSLHEAMLASSAQPGRQTPLTGNVTAPQAPAVKGDWQKFVTLRKGADRGGVHTQPAVLQFVGQLGERMGRRLVIGTGTNHSHMTTSGNVSDHWDGHAADVPAAGKYLTRLGRQALIAAGMSPKEAGKAKGGIYNVGGYQIIFNTREGGNHWNHLHVGISH